MMLKRQFLFTSDQKLKRPTKTPVFPYATDLEVLFNIVVLYGARCILIFISRLIL